MAKILIGNNDVYANKDGKTLVLNAGAEVEIDEKQAEKLVSMGKATAKPEPKKATAKKTATKK